MFETNQLRVRSTGSDLLVCILVVLAVAATTLIAATPAAAAYFNRQDHTSPPWYSHAWYITRDTPGYFENLGVADGGFDNTWLCSGGYYKDTLTILDFFGPAANVGPPTDFGGYGTLLGGSSQPEPDANIVGAVSSYAAGWYRNTGQCPRLNLVIGTNNSTVCAQDSGCSGGAGNQWGNVVRSVNDYLNVQGFAWQIVALGADDIEPSWAPYPPTLSFVQAFMDNNPQGNTFINFGSADGCPTSGVGPCNNGWSMANVQTVSWMGTAWPEPENYIRNGVMAQQWVNIKQYYPMTIIGAMSDTEAADLIPSWGDPNCHDRDLNPVNCDTEAWGQIWQRMIDLGIGQPSMNFLTNIRWT